MTDRDWKGDGNSIWKTLGASNHTDKEREQDDYYATDPVAIDKLLTVERPHRQIWECACGAGHLSERLEKAGYSVLSTDIRDRGYGKFGGEIDFLRVHSDYAPFAGDFDILTNPPYKYAKEFVIKSLDLLPPGCRCYMFLKLTFLEGKARYAELFKSTPPVACTSFPSASFARRMQSSTRCARAADRRSHTGGSYGRRGTTARQRSGGYRRAA